MNQLHFTKLHQLHYKVNVTNVNDEEVDGMCEISDLVIFVIIFTV